MNRAGREGSVFTQTSAREVSIQIDFKKVHCWCVPATCIHTYIYTCTPTRAHTHRLVKVSVTFILMFS